MPKDETPIDFDRRWVLIHRPLVVVGGELTLENADLTWSEAAKFYEAPFQMKSNGGTLVIDDFGRQRVAPQDLLNRWIVPLERRVDYLALHTGKKIEVPFEQLVVFSTNLEEKDLADQAFLRRMGYRARVEPPTAGAYTAIFKQQAEPAWHRSRTAGVGPHSDEVSCGAPSDEGLRTARHCSIEPQTFVCLKARALHLTPQIVDIAWRNYFGTSHTFAPEQTQETMIERTLADPLEL